MDTLHQSPFIFKVNFGLEQSPEEGGVLLIEIASHGRLPEYVPELVRDWIYGEAAASGRSRISLVAIMETLFRRGGMPMGQAKLAREAGLANNTVAAGYAEMPEMQIFWQGGDHEIDFVLDPNRFLEVKRGKVQPFEFSWFPKAFPKGHLTIINKSRFETERIRGVTLEDFLLEKP